MKTIFLSLMFLLGICVLGFEVRKIVNSSNSSNIVNLSNSGNSFGESILLPILILRPILLPVLVILFGVALVSTPLAVFAVEYFGEEFTEDKKKTKK